MPRPLRDADRAVLAFRQLDEEIRRRPIHELDQEAVGERADHVDGDLVDQVRRQRHAVRGGELADAQGLGEAVGAADVGHRVLHRLAVEELLELPAGVVVLAARDRDANRARDLRVAVVVVGEHRLLVPNEIELFEQPRLLLVADDVPALIDVDHHAYAGAERFLHRADAARIHGRIGMVDLHLVVLAAERRVLLGFGNQLVDRILCPAAAAVGADALAHGAPELVQRLFGRLAGDVPQADVERRKRVGGDALLFDAHVDPEHLFPEALDEEWVLADQRRLQTRVEIGEDRFSAAAVEHQAVAEPAQALVGGDLRHHQLVLRVLHRHWLGRRDGEQAGIDRGDLHGRGWYCGPALARRGAKGATMKAFTIIAASLAFALAGSHPLQAAAGGSSAPKGGSSAGSSMQTPSGGATGQKSEGSTDTTNAPKRPSSPTAPGGK